MKNTSLGWRPISLCLPRVNTANRILIRSAQPGILPRYGNVLVVSAEANIRAIAVAGFDGLVFADREGNRPSDARTGLFGR